MALSENDKVRARSHQQKRWTGAPCLSCGEPMRADCQSNYHKLCRPPERKVVWGSVCVRHGTMNPCVECNREKHSAWMRAWRKTPGGKSSSKQSMRDWHERNPDYQRKRAARRYASDPAYRFRIHEHTRARRAGAAPLTEEQRAEVFALTDGCCFYCGSHADTVDHYIAIAKGGSHTLPNLVPACRSCNCKKCDRSPVKFLEEMAS